MNKKAVSPVIATVLLIAITIFLALMVFVWFSYFGKEAVTKNGENIDNYCNLVQLDASISGSSIDIDNKGSVPVDNIAILDSKGGSTVVRECGKTGLLPVGRSASVSKSECGVVGTPVKLIPILKGDEQNYKCKKEILIG